MAASSGGIDWSLVLKPFLSSNYETSNTTELIELCSTIVRSESEIWRHKDSHKNFYNTFAVLASDYISSRTSNLSGSELETVSAACRFLLKYLLTALQSASSESHPDSAVIERYLNAIRVLCFGTGLLSTTEVSSLVDTMKGENLPHTADTPPSGNEKETTPTKQGSSKNRADLSVAIFEQLTLPIRDGSSPSVDYNSTSGDTTVPETVQSTNVSSEINRLFLKSNTESLQALRAGDTLVDLCLNLPSIKASKTKVDEALAGRAYAIPTNHSEATTLRNALPVNLSEIKLAMSAISLPVLEPLSSTKLDKLCNLATAVLYCAVEQTVANAYLSATTLPANKGSNQQSQNKEDDLDCNAVALVEEALHMYNYIGNTISTSSRAGGNVYQNYMLAGAWVLILGLQTHLTACTSSCDKTSHQREREEKSRSTPPTTKTRDVTSARSGLQKFQQSFGVLSVALASKALSLLSDLFEDLSLDVCGGGASNIVQIEPAPLAIMGQFSALQRVARVLGAAPLNHLLFYWAIVSYRKACSLRRLHPPEGDNFSQSDSATYYEDMILCSDEGSTDEDDDSEPILGQWFESTLAPPENVEAKTPSSSDNTESKPAQCDRTARSIVPEKGESYGYISLATSVFTFLNKHFLCSKSTLVSRYVKNGLTEQQMIILAAIIRDLDREDARSKSGVTSAYLSQQLKQLYCEFSSALSKFTHNLITNNNLNSLQACLLNHLGVSPWYSDVPHEWPLEVYPRTLSVLAQVLLLRPQNEKEAAVISMWHRLVNTLIENVLNVQSNVPDSEFEDLNVEHAQVLLYLFNSLNLLQKKSVLLLMAGGVLRCSEVARGVLKDSQILNLSRLLLLFDYIMKHLYDAPVVLLEQIKANLFHATNLSTEKDKDTNSSTKSFYTPWQDIEENYTKISPVDDCSMRPRFYVLSNLEVNFDVTKLDGLACNFIMGTQDKLRYPLLLDALIEILNITNGTSTAKMTFLGQCAVQYCFTVCWRLLQLLPPSVPYMERLATGESIAPGPLLLHSLIWGPRSSHKNFNKWLKDCLVKQGMYNQHSEKLLKGVSDTVNDIKYCTTNAKNCIIALTPDISKGYMSKEDLPPLWNLYLLDAMLASAQLSLDDPKNVADASNTASSVTKGTYEQELLPHVLKLAQSILHCTRWSLFHTVIIMDQSEPASGLNNLQSFENLLDVVAIASKRNALTLALASEIGGLLPNTVNSVLKLWHKSNLDESSPKASQTSYQSDIAPGEKSLIWKIVEVHVSTLSKSHPFSLTLSLKRLLQRLIKFICDHAPTIENTDTKNKAIELLVSVTLDSTTEYLYESVTKTLDKMIGDTETDEHQKRVYLRVLDHTYRLILKYTSNLDSTGYVDQKILLHCLKFYEKIIEKASGRQALETFFTNDKELVKVLMSVATSTHTKAEYCTRVLHFFNKLFDAAEKSSTDPSLNYLCSSMRKLVDLGEDKLQTCLRHIVLAGTEDEAGEKDGQKKSDGEWTSDENKENPSTPPATTSVAAQKTQVQENTKLLKALTCYLVKQNSNVSEEVIMMILKALIPVGKHIVSNRAGVGFSDLMGVMTMLADAGSGKGHTLLFPATSEWIDWCYKNTTSIKDLSETIANNPESIKDYSRLDAAACILDYVSDVICSITTTSSQTSFRAMSPPWESETLFDIDNEWLDDLHEEEDSGEDSDEDSLCNKLCTFTITQKEFMNQHWYHCHTCKMLDGVGVCSICAKVCHKGHDLSYAKYGNFFCDCGAKEDGSCLALVKRNTGQSDNAAANVNSNATDHILQSSLRRRASSPVMLNVYKEKRTSLGAKQVDDATKDYLVEYLSSSSVTGSLIEFLQALIPAIEVTCNQNSPVGCQARAVKALKDLYSPEKEFVHTEKLMLPTVGSQEGAFENVRMSYAGEQGQTIRQLLSAHIIRRVAMCCMTTTQGKRQHLAVSHEKGKISVLQLSTLLKQADSATRKLTLTRLGSAPIPFTVLSMTSNLCNEDFLAVCGLKDCHVLTFNNNGQVTDHVVLHPQLETGNFIIKAVWLPGSQTQLALVTADFVKIYDLSKDVLSPEYLFLVPSGKIRDCTFMYEENKSIYYILLMSSPGHIYTEVLNEDSSTKYGSFYVTNTIDVFSLEVRDVNGQVGGGGVSIYYSHTLMLLFFSYAQGECFISPLIPKKNSLSLMYPLTLPPINNSNSKSNSSRSPAPQPLCQWTEIPNHPGLICCVMQSSNQPVVLMLKPDSVLIQEIKVVPAKSKIMDMVAIRHNSGSELRTTLILLCEDGSLKMFIANMEQTGFWMSPNIQATVTGQNVKPKKKKAVKSGKSTNSITFPVDFFEHCVAMNDVEFGGNDVLQIYNTAQLKHRLNTTGLFVACDKPLGFQLEITNNDANMVMCGIRILVGSQDTQKAPSFVEIFGRIISLSVTRSRWYDLPLLREESLQADKKLTILFGPSQDAETVTIVDSVKVYGKTKDSFGWPEESDDNATAESKATNSAPANVTVPEPDQETNSAIQLNKLEKLVVGILESLDRTFSLYSPDDKLSNFKPSTINLSTQILTLPTPPSIQIHSKALLSSLHVSKQSYHNYKDQALLKYVSTRLNDMKAAAVNIDEVSESEDDGKMLLTVARKITDLDAEDYYRLVLVVRGIAVSRPQNLVKFAETQTSIQDVTLTDPLEPRKEIETQHLLLQIINKLWLFHGLKPEKPMLAPVVVPGLKHVEHVVHALIEIIHAFDGHDAYSDVTITLYLQLLLCEDPFIAFSAKQALCKVLKPKSKRRRVYIPSPPRCVSPIAKNLDEDKRRREREVATPQEPSAIVAPVAVHQPPGFDVDAVEVINLLEQPGGPNHNMNPLEALLGGAVGFPPLLDIPPDADDETMVELAIALSLQDHQIGGDQNAALQHLQSQLGNVAGQAAQAQEAANLSDTTTSAGGSDDEGSTAATDGSTLRTSPAEQGGSAGSESGGSGVDSITGEHNVSGRSSAYGDNNIQEALNLGSRSETSSLANVPNCSIGGSGAPTEADTQVQDEEAVESEISGKLHALRLQLLEKLIDYLPKLKNTQGVRTIPFFQVVSQLTADLDGHSERDRACLNSLLTAIVEELQLQRENVQDMCSRSKAGEVHLLLMKLISNLLQRTKSAPASSTSKTSGSVDTSNFVAKTSATFLHKAGLITYCLRLCQTLLNDYWKNLPPEETNTTSSSSSSNNATPTSGILLKPRLTHPLPDMAPFFVKTQLKDNSTDVFTNFNHLVTEITLRLPYQVQRLSEQQTESVFEGPWYRHLAEYMMTSLPAPCRRNARKLLLYICGNKEKYRQLRDLHALSTHMKGVRICCAKGGYQADQDLQHALSLPYDSLVELVEHLKLCLEIAQARTGNWQRFCLQTVDMLSFLLRVSFLLDDGVAPTILQLLQSALVYSNPPSKKTGASESSRSGVNRKEREKSDDSNIEALFEESSCAMLVEQLNKQVSKEIFARFVKTFTLENNTTTVRWQAHGLVVAIYKNSKPKEQESIVELLWKLWPLLPSYGKKAAQFVDLLGFFSIKSTENAEDGQKRIDEYVDRTVAVLHAQNAMLSHHPNANLYAHMSQYVEFDGYYLESEPCLVCNNPEVPFSTIKLSSIKVDSKFTTTTQIVKLLGSHTISKITVRIGDLKRTKMVRTVNIYYNNRSVQAVVELKNKPALWHKAKKVTLQSGQAEVKIEFPLPIVACNLMVEYADFYENIQASSETLLCPRCSASVPANPGVCGNCGENVFQCHKCRAINYDEKDPFLCHACGFCKYAKFDFTLQAKPCCAVEPIENDDDRKKTVSSINSLLEKADRVYKQLISNKPTLESLVLKIAEHRTDKKPDETTQSTSSQNAVPPAQGSQIKINKTIQMLAQNYCTDCKSSFEDLSKIIQKVLVSRKELVAYDRKHRDIELPSSASVLDDLPVTSDSPCVINRCYGCSTAATEHCLTLLRALAINTTTRQTLCSKGLVQELFWNNLRKGSVYNQEDVRQLLCTLTRDNHEATEDLCYLLMERITLSLNGNVISTDLAANVRHEIGLLAAMVQKEDECWELKLRCMMNLFLIACDDSKSPLVMESVILPCLKIVLSLIKTPDEAAGNTNTVKKAKDKSSAGNTGKNNQQQQSQQAAVPEVVVNVRKFLNKEAVNSFDGWKNFVANSDQAEGAPLSKETVRSYYLSEKYAKRWHHRVKKLKAQKNCVDLSTTSWIKSVLFNPCSRQARQVACSIIETMCNTYERKKNVVTLLTSFLSELCKAGESAAEYLALYQNLIQEVPWKQYLTIRGLLLELANLMTAEIEELHRLEVTTLTSDLAQGYSLNQLTELLASFLDDSSIRRQHKGRLVGAVLNGYLSLRRLVVQRTRLIDDTQEKLLELLEEMTTGTEEETKAFMSVCIQTVERYSLQDILTPVFIFERLCSIIYPEENDIGEFFLTLEKDPQQEDFLQGRMLGNPYSSNEAGLGPLMRDVKNKICQDCELVALLEDDNGMELLVNNKIMSLDLPVKDVYNKVWLAEGGDHEAMRVVYRMRGLLGDATEEFIETLANKTQSTVDNEEVYKMANVLAECDGLKTMVTRLGAIQNVRRAKPLVQVLLKLFRLSVKVNKCQEVLIQPELGAMEVFLRILQLCLDSDIDSSQAAVTEQLLDIMETVLSKATSGSFETFEKFSHTFGGPEYVKSLLSFTSHPSVRNNNALLIHLTKVLAALVYGNKEKMDLLLEHFKPVLEFNRYDFEHTVDDQQKLEMFCMLTNSIEKNAIGNTLKDYIISLDILKNALEYITMHAPCVKPTLLRTDSDELKDFISKPALKYILRFLTGLAHSHENTQLEISKAETIPIIHRLEQVSSDEHVGSLAENLLEALCTNPTVAKRIEEVRDYTRSEKKRLAMAMREKQLGQLGMRTNDKGQVTAKSTILQQIEELGEESGLVCCICREGYKYQPTKVLGIYTFTKRCNVEDFEAKQRKTVGYTTVTHFNIVHIDCHMSAVRLARARDEWESAALQNANTKCNGLLPLWGPQVPESAFASCLARHNTYLQESTNHRDIGHSSTIHDLKLLLLRFAQEKPFHEDTGGGGPQSNLHMVPYLIHVGLYVINTTRVFKRELNILSSYESNRTRTTWVESSYQSEGPLYMATLSLFLHNKVEWSKVNLDHLTRLLVLAQARYVQPTGPATALTEREVKDYAVYKPYLVFWGLIDGVYKYFFKDVEGADEQWPKNLADFIRHNDEGLMKASEKLLAYYTEELLPCTSFSEFCDVTGLLEAIPNPESYLTDVLNSVK